MKTYTLTDDQLNRLFSTLSSEVGARLSLMDEFLANATSAFIRGDVDTGRKYVESAHKVLAKTGIGAKALETVLKEVRDSATVTPDDPAPPRPRLTEEERERAADHPRLTGVALRAVLTGNYQKDGRYWLPGVDDDQVARWYVNAYAPGQGGVYSNSTYSTVAQLSDDELARMEAKYPNPADWMKDELHNNPVYIATQMRRTPTWADLKRMAGRE